MKQTGEFSLATIYLHIIPADGRNNHAALIEQQFFDNSISL